MDKPKIKEVIVIEGRYDKNTLSQIVDATIVQTDGFGVFRDREKLAFLRRLADKRGLIVFTDSDGAGFVIRNHIKGAISADKLKHAYIPDIYGKEKRKKVGGKEGKLGVEGMTREVILNSLKCAGATFEDASQEPPRERVTKSDLCERGLTGGADSAEKRAALLQALSLPERLTTNGMLEAINLIMSRDEFFKLDV